MYKHCPLGNTISHNHWSKLLWTPVHNTRKIIVNDLFGDFGIGDIRRQRRRQTTAKISEPSPQTSKSIRPSSGIVMWCWIQEAIHWSHDQNLQSHSLVYRPVGSPVRFRSVVQAGADVLRRTGNAFGAASGWQRRRRRRRGEAAREEEVWDEDFINLWLFSTSSTC